MKPFVLAVLGVLAVNVLYVDAWGKQKVTVEGRFTCCRRGGSGQVAQFSRSTEERVPSKSKEQQGPWVPPEGQQHQKRLTRQRHQRKKVPPKTQPQLKVPTKGQEQVQTEQVQEQLREWQKPKQLNEQELQQRWSKLRPYKFSVQRKAVPKERSADFADRCIPEAQTGVAIELWEDDTLDLDDLLAETTTDARGNFQVSGGEFEVGSIEPYLVIRHDCEAAANQKLEPGCNFVTKMPVPNKHINGGPLVINSFEDFLATHSEASTVQNC